MNSDESITAALENTNQQSIGVGGEHNTTTIVKELLDLKNINFISELTGEQINEIVKLKNIARRFSKIDFPELNKVYPVEDTINNIITDFMIGMISYKRKRVIEFLDGLVGERKNVENKPDFIERMKNAFVPK